jgi:putative transposase
MRRIDERHLTSPLAGARMLRDLLRREGHRIGHNRVRTVMTRIGIEALYGTPNTSQRYPAHRVDPDRLRHLTITQSNPVGVCTISAAPMMRGLVYLFAVLGWASRRVLAWRLANTLKTDFCIEAVQVALANYGTPDIFNADQGYQFTSQDFAGLLKDHGTQISMDGTGCWRDNVFAERLWRSVNEEV